MNRSVRFKGFCVLAVPLVALLGVVGASLGLQLQERAQRSSAIRVNAMSTAAAKVLATAIDAQTGVRGYAGTSDAVFLEPYTAARARLAGDLLALRQAAATAGSQAGAEVEVIAATASDQFAVLARLSAAVRAGLSKTALTVQLQTEKTVLDRLRGQVAAFVAEPSRLTVQRRNAITALERRIEIVDMTGLCLGLLAGLAGVALFASGIAGRLATAADNADRLGQGLPLAATVPARDELGRLAQALTRAEELLASRLGEVTSARDEALHATEAKNNFLSRTSHELRTPLNAILGFAQLLEMSELDSDDHDSAERILAAGRHLLALINELIDIARIESGDLKLSVEPVAVQALTDSVVTLMWPLAEARSITIGQHCPNPGLAARADQQRLKQILINLVSNAVKYNRDRGTIDITCQEAGLDRVQIAVTDSGPGLTPQETELIFVPFERLHAEHTIIEGTGIGLPLTLALAKAMDGELTVTSNPGNGSTFTLSVPRAADIPSTAGPHTPTATNPPAHTDTDTDLDTDADPGTTVRVLSIEDNPENSRVLARYLTTRTSMTLHSTASGLVGVDLAQRLRPDIILLDLHLPDLPGEQVYTRLRAEPATATIPVIVLSADATPGTIRRLLARGANAYLTKPLDLHELGETLTTLLEPHDTDTTDNQPMNAATP